MKSTTATGEGNGQRLEVARKDPRRWGGRSRGVGSKSSEAKGGGGNWGGAERPGGGRGRSKGGSEKERKAGEERRDRRKGGKMIEPRGLATRGWRELCRRGLVVGTKVQQVSTADTGAQTRAACSRRHSRGAVAVRSAADAPPLSRRGRQRPGTPTDGPTAERVRQSRWKLAPGVCRL